MAFTALSPVTFSARPMAGRPSTDPNPAAATPVHTRAAARRMHEAKLAADLLPELPAPGETIHAMMSGRYDLAQVIVATVRRWPVAHLRITSLSANKRTLRELIAEVDAGTVSRITLLLSGFFARHNKELFQAIREEVQADHPGSRIAAAKCHAKIALFEFRDGSIPLVLEGSANLRKNDSVEQLTATRSRELHDWHAGWIDRLVSAHATDRTEDDAA